VPEVVGNDDYLCLIGVEITYTHPTMSCPGNVQHAKGVDKQTNNNQFIFQTLIFKSSSD
jgi:hypothetical protein